MTDPIPPDMPVPPQPIRDPRVWLAVGLGIGLVPVAPGTFGSLWGPVLVWGLASVGIVGYWLVPTTILLFLLGVPICAAGAKHFQRKDPPWVVFDEIVAFPLMYVLTPLTWWTALLGFALFRFFDVLKPWPIKRFEALPGGWGIMIDDYLAAIHAMIVLRVLMLILAG